MRIVSGCRSGYTMVELLIGLSIAALMLAAGAPFLKGYLDSRAIDAASGNMVSRLDLIRHRAVAEHERFLVRFDFPETGQYLAFADRNGNQAPDEDEPVVGPSVLPHGVTVDEIALGDDGFVEFLPSGMVQAGQGGTVTLVDNSGRRTVVEIYASGSARVRH